MCIRDRYEDVSYRFSMWDPDDREKYIGTPEQWDEAQGAMRRILDHLQIPYKEGCLLYTSRCV